MNPTRLLSVLAAASLLAACASEPLPPPPPPPPPLISSPAAGSPVFRPDDFNWSTIPGPGRINGHLAFGRGMFTCAGAGVVLTPETPWVRNRMQTLYGSTSAAALPATEVRARTPKASENYSAYVRSATCDAANKFSFQGLANGAWYVITVSRPQAGKGEDMAVMRRVIVVDGRPIALEL